MNWADQIGQVVIGFDASDPEKRPTHIGPMRGYMPNPTVLIEGSASGRLTHWSSLLCRLATPEETIDYWRQRAEFAEQALRDQASMQEHGK